MNGTQAPSESTLARTLGKARRSGQPHPHRPTHSRRPDAPSWGRVMAQAGVGSAVTETWRGADGIESRAKSGSTPLERVREPPRLSPQSPR